MKIFLFLIIVIHGLIHLIGFIKAYNLADISALTQSISKPIGIVWLLTALLFLFSLIVFSINKQWWWMPAVVAVITSQLLIILSWQDAKVGTIANVFILIAALFSYGAWNFNVQTEKEIQSILSEGKSAHNKIITEEMITHLPTIVQKWLTNSGMVGKENIQNVYLKQSGLMKLEPDQEKWKKAEAVQYITTDQPAFLWKVDMEMMPFIHAAGRDKFRDGKGDLKIKLGSLVTVANVNHNKKVDESSLHRYLLELAWYPSAALSPFISWEEIDDYSAKATMNYNGVSGSATFYFNENGDFKKVSALRFKDNDKGSERIECVGEAIETRIINGLKIPTKINITWMLDEGPFTWYKLEVFDVEYNAFNAN